MPGAAIQTALVAADGRSVVASATHDVAGGYQHGTILAKIVSMSAITGRVTATERTVTIHYHSSVGRYAAESACQVLSLDPTGRHTLALCRSLGSLAGARFTPLPGSVGYPLVPAAAW